MFHAGAGAPFEKAQALEALAILRNDDRQHAEAAAIFDRLGVIARPTATSRLADLPNAVETGSMPIWSKIAEGPTSAVGRS